MLVSLTMWIDRTPRDSRILVPNTEKKYRVHSNFNILRLKNMKIIKSIDRQIRDKESVFCLLV